MGETTNMTGANGQETNLPRPLYIPFFVAKYIRISKTRATLVPLFLIDFLPGNRPATLVNQLLTFVPSWKPTKHKKVNFITTIENRAQLHLSWISAYGIPQTN